MPNYPTSYSSKLLTGNPGKRRLAPARPPAPPNQLPPPPEELSDEAKTVFIKTGNLVLGLGLNPDSEALTRYAENTVIIRRAHRELLDEPMFVIAANGSCAPHPAIRMAREFEPLVVKFESENGLSAASRARLGIQVGPSVAEEPSPTSKYLT